MECENTYSFVIIYSLKSNLRKIIALFISCPNKHTYMCSDTFKENVLIIMEHSFKLKIILC